jgi:kynurenine 3-monooxygenase
MKVIIVGGGLVGSLASYYFAKRGEQVKVFELRKGIICPCNCICNMIIMCMCVDPRKNPGQRGRSINLALSTRGLAALEAVGLDGLARNEMIPMSGRMLHSLDGKQRRVQYGAYGEVSVPSFK